MWCFEHYPVVQHPGHYASLHVGKLEFGFFIVSQRSSLITVGPNGKNVHELVNKILLQNSTIPDLNITFNCNSNKTFKNSPMSHKAFKRRIKWENSY